MIPWHEKTWCLPPTAPAECVARMEDVLDLYQVPYAPPYPVVCMDELCTQWIAETRLPLPVREGSPALYDSEYERKGVWNIFLFVAPRRGWRKVFVHERRTKGAWATCVRVLRHAVYPEARCIRLVPDNLNTPLRGSRYEGLPPAEARGLARRLAIHYTPQHGSGLNMAETAFSILPRPCLDRRIDATALVQQEVGHWEAERNAQHAMLHWRFIVADARVKLKHIYPAIKI